MGTPSTRITAQDFVTPPELSAWSLSGNGAGRIGGLRVELSIRDQKTAFAQCYQQVPIRVLPPFQVASNASALIFLLNPTAGLMDGDGHRFEILVRSGAHVVIVGQSATRIHPCLEGFATQQWHIEVEDDASALFLPGPAIPYAGCRYFQRVEAHLAPRGQLLWGDILHAGRYSRQEDSEAFQFTWIVQEFAVLRQQRLVFRDRFAWNGPWDQESISWHFGNNPACGSVFATGLHAVAQESPLAVFETAYGDHCARITGASEKVIAQVVHQALAWQKCDSQISALLDSTHLAPCHWFSCGMIEQMR